MSKTGLKIVYIRETKAYMSLSSESLNSVLNHCKEVIGQKGYVIIRQERTNIKPPINELDIEDAMRVAVLLCVSGEFIWIAINDGGDVLVSKNPSYKLQESVISTNKTNRLVAWLAAGFAFLSAVAAIATFFKANEKLSPSLQMLDTTMRMQGQKLDSTYIYLKELNHSIQNVADSVSK